MHWRVVRRDGNAVERETEHRALLLEHPNDGVRSPFDPKRTSNGVQVGKEVFSDFVSDHDHRSAKVCLLSSKRTASVYVVFLDREIIAVDCVPLDLLRSGELRLGLKEIHALNTNAGTRGQNAFNQSQIRVVDAGPAQPAAPFLLGSSAVSKPGESAQSERVDAQQLGGELVLHVAAHALDDGDHGNEKHHADADAE